MRLWYLDCIPLYHHVPLLDHHVVILSPWYPQYIPNCLIHTHLLSKSQAAKAGTMAWRHASLSAFTMWKWSAPGISTSTGPSNAGPNALNTYPLRMVYSCITWNGLLLRMVYLYLHRFSISISAIFGDGLLFGLTTWYLLVNQPWDQWEITFISVRNQPWNQ